MVADQQIAAEDNAAASTGGTSLQAGRPAPAWGGLCGALAEWQGSNDFSEFANK
ncbi:hypothetical protein Scep_028281 [Stephania cephalantha]|uniref:Uncharacterized protein n=1 Tax=Stephania cephalantha TaxID=152367 RepID=A0AAP0EI09_9MAGN